MDEVTVGSVIVLGSGEIPQQETEDGHVNTWLGARARVTEEIRDTFFNMLEGEEVFYKFEILEDDREGRLQYGHTDGPLDTDGHEFNPESVWLGIAYQDEIAEVVSL